MMHVHGQCATDPYRLHMLERRVEMLERMLLIQHQANDVVMQLSSLQRCGPMGMGVGMGMGMGGAAAAPASAPLTGTGIGTHANASDPQMAAPQVNSSSRRAVS